MPHIHTGKGEIDVVVNVYVVCRGRVLLRLHEKYHRWFTPGGHVELNETPEEAAAREVKEEVGLDITLWKENKLIFESGFASEEYRECIPPVFMNIHRINDDHRHLSLAYFGESSSDKVREPDTHERSGGCRWLTRTELEADPEVDHATKYYALAALAAYGA